MTPRIKYRQKNRQHNIDKRAQMQTTQINNVILSGNGEYCMALGFEMLRRPSRDSVGSMGGARRPESRGCGCRPTARGCMVGWSILNSMIDSRGMPYRRTIYCNACTLSGSVLQVCLRRLVFVCTSVLRSLDSGRSCGL